MLTAKVLFSICLKAGVGGRNHEKEIYPCWPEDEPKFWLKSLFVERRHRRREVSQWKDKFCRFCLNWNSVFLSFMHQREQKKCPNKKILKHQTCHLLISWRSFRSFPKHVFWGKQTALRINNKLHLLSALIYLCNSNEVSNGQSTWWK